jgi:hypothetical protein
VFFLPVQGQHFTLLHCSTAINHICSTPINVTTATPQPHAAVGAAPAISVAVCAGVTAGVEADDPAFHHARAGQVDVEPWRHHHLHAGRFQRPRPAGRGVLHEPRVEARASLGAHNGERRVDGARQEADAPHALGGEEEGLQQRLRPRPRARPAERGHHLAHLGVAEAAEPLAVVLGAVEEDLLPREHRDGVVRREVGLAPARGVRGVGVGVGVQLEVGVERAVEEALEARTGAGGAAEVGGQRAREVPHGGAGGRDGAEEGVDGEGGRGGREHARLEARELVLQLGEGVLQARGLLQRLVPRARGRGEPAGEVGRGEAPLLAVPRVGACRGRRGRRRRARGGAAGEGDEQRADDGAGRRRREGALLEAAVGEGHRRDVRRRAGGVLGPAGCCLVAGAAVTVVERCWDVRVLLVGLLRRRLGAASLLLRLGGLTAHHCAVNDSYTQPRQNRGNRGEEAGGRREGGTLTPVGKGGEGDETMATAKRMERYLLRDTYSSAMLLF